MRLNKTLTFAIQFAHKAALCKASPYDFGVLLALADKVYHAGVAQCNHSDNDTDRKLEKAREQFEAHAKSMGFEVGYPGLYPSLVLDGFDFYLPG